MSRVTSKATDGHDLTRVGPGTVMGEMMRQYWIPAAASSELKVDGGASVNNALMQFQADLLGVTVKRPAVSETTALGAAYLAGLAVGYWQDPSDVTRNWVLDRQFSPSMPAAHRDALYARWKKAVSRVLDWEDR